MPAHTDPMMQSALMFMTPCTAHSRDASMSTAQPLCSYNGMRKAAPIARFGAPAAPALSLRRMASGRRATLIVEARAGARKVALLGAAGGIGQPLALLLKMQPYVAELALYDIANTVGVAADLSHCNTTVKARQISSASDLTACTPMTSCKERMMILQLPM